MEIFFSIRDWEKLYENHRTRTLKRMEYVCIPNRMDGDGFTELLDHPNGAAHFGAWCALLQVASRCSNRGELIRDGGTPHTAETLSRITRIPAEILTEAITRLVSIGWVSRRESGANPAQNGAVAPESAARYAPESAPRIQNGMEGNGTEHIYAAPCGAPPRDEAPPPASPPPPDPVIEAEADDDGWGEFVDAVTAARMPYSGEDLTAMRTRWGRVPIEGRLAAVRHCRDSIDIGNYGPGADPQFIPNARSYLFEKRWERGVRKRAGPVSIQQSKTVRAAEIWLQQGGGA